MFFKKRTAPRNDQDMKPDCWGREPLELYEKVGRIIQRNPENPLRSSEGKPINDLMVLFYNGKPDVRGIGGLLYAAEWINYGTKIYRINTLHSALEIKDLVMEELLLDPSEFLISQTFIDPRMPRV